MSTLFQVRSFNVGLPVAVAHGAKTIETGIFKTSVSGRVNVHAGGPEGDGQADLIHHGGPDKALCVYFSSHYPYWEERLNCKLEWGSFGENITLDGGTERDLRIGDILTIGSATVQVSQPRQPCFKIGIRHGLPELTVWVQTTGYTGLYFRVLEEGAISAGDTASIIERPSHEITVAEANHIYYERKRDISSIRKLLTTPELAASWREALETRLDKLAHEGEGG
ncbi:MOSC domain-containing protein [Paenibacillus beijingensis]|uniref:MOSC domain-containing protein n=1 Tax=Paenibacillus beijingensis TaxID=1126833 RepID=A0A0D5NQ28_9BACL|nr:MOSC domain-containing protein [Paenibacillus beijingensis]AJY77038.1 hypothetical protein VN24_23910 [Paenibacillus beijingensis]